VMSACWASRNSRTFSAPLSVMVIIAFQSIARALLG
jgi:hypothetical protein